MSDSYAQVSPLRRARSLSALFVYANIFLGCAVLRLALLQPSKNNIWTDSQDYLRMARWPLFSIPFWAGARPVGILLIYKLLDAIPERIIYFQFLLALICWGVLGSAVARFIRVRWLRPVAFAVILLFSLSRDIVQWDLIILTESITSSLFALIVGIWLFAIELYRKEGQRPQKRLMLCLLIATTALWSFTRDANAYFVLGLTGILAVGLLFKGIRSHPHIKHYIILIITLVAIFVIQGQSANVYGRWRYPLINIIGKRILVDDDRTAFFAAHGMPTDTKVMRYKDNYGHAHGNAILRDADMEYFRQWMSARGIRTYMLFLVSHPLETLTEPLERLDLLLKPPVGYYGDRALLVFPGWVYALSAIVYPHPLELLLPCIGAIALLAIILTMMHRSRPEWAVPAALLLLTYPMMLIIWHGDSLEVGRHSFLLAMQFRLAGWLLLLFLADAWLMRSDRRGADVL